MSNYIDTYYKDANDNVFYLSAQDLKNLDAGIAPSPIQSDWVIITYEEAMAIANPPYIPTQAETISEISYAIQQALDAGAQAWGYDNMVTASSYVMSTSAQYAADALALIAWRDNVWEWAMPLFPSIVAGESSDTFMIDMPVQPAQPAV